MMPETELPYSFCKRYGVIAALSPISGKLKLTLKNGAQASAIAEAQRLLGMIDEIAFESDIEFNRMLSKHFENNRETSFIEAEKIGGELNLDDVARELSEQRRRCADYSPDQCVDYRSNQGKCIGYPR
jgi:general secretion pathway protein E